MTRGCQLCGSPNDCTPLRDLDRVCQHCVRTTEIVTRSCDGCGLTQEHVQYYDGLTTPHPQYRCIDRHDAPCGAPCVRGPTAQRGHGSTAYPCTTCGSTRQLPEIASAPGLRTALTSDPVGTRVVVIRHEPHRIYVDVIAEHRPVPARRGGEPFDWVRLEERGWWPTSCCAVIP